MLVAVEVGVAVAVDVAAGVAVAVPDALDAGVTWACDCVAERCAWPASPRWAWRTRTG